MKDYIIELVNINKDYGKTETLKNISLYIRRNEFMTLLGPSGCGKTTTLRIIAGFEQPSYGTVLFKGKDINDLPPYQRELNTVFQNYALFPHLNIFENIAFGLRIKKADNSLIEDQVKSMLELVNLKGFEKRLPDSLSGGQQQRVAIARALVNRPQVLLLDEPLGALDLKLRKEMQLELKNMQKALGITFLYVTHDQEEALTMSDTIVVMNQGRIQQIGTPVDIYNEPKNAFVADFIGESNIVDGIMTADFQVSFAGRQFECLDKGFSPDEPVDVVVRPEDIKLVSSGKGMLKGLVEGITFKGVHYEIIIAGEGMKWKIHSTGMKPIGSYVGLDITPEDIHIMKKDNEQ